MPPKKPTDKKSKKGPAQQPKVSKKEKKLWTKYGNVKTEGPASKGEEVSIMTFRRDELQWAAERLRDQVTSHRDERIRFQLERDFLYDLMEGYWKKYKCLKIEMEKKIASTNKMNQDADDNRFIKGIQGKHFRFEAQINATAMDARDDIRQKRLKELMEEEWRKITTQMDNIDDIIEQNAAKYRKKISDTVEELDDLQDYVDDHSKQLDELKTKMQAEMENSMKLFDLLRRMDYQLTEERWSEFIWKLSKNWENQYAALKNYYNDATHSNLTLIFTLQDWMNDSIDKMKMYEEQILEYEHLIRDAHEKLPQVKKTYVEKKVAHDFIVRTQRAMKTTKKEIMLQKGALNNYTMEYRTLLHNLNEINNERQAIKSSCEGLIVDAMDMFKERYDIVNEENTTLESIDKFLGERGRLSTYFSSPEAFRRTVYKYKGLLDKKDERVERLRLKKLRVHKQTEDLRSTLEARLLRIGLHKKHAVLTPETEEVFGRAKRLNWAPANLVARKSYPAPQALWAHRIPCPPLLDDTEVKVCMTDSIKGFVAWKNHNRTEKRKQAQRTQAQQQKS